ncbi:MAG: YdeI/OmpD-associated family protein [Candidatus Heimdallarchaeota archaeon]|nr:YdeI/OmpD-associated family protein [Candidatus Heimdallarchaeota archaeon]
MEQLRTICLEVKLQEEIKWGKPCYSCNENNVVIIQPFKAYCALMFFKGALLKDPNNLLIQLSKNTQAARQIRITNLGEIDEKREYIKEYILEAIEVEKAGLKVQLKETDEYDIPEEFQDKLEGFPELRAAFESLTPGRQRQYLLYFSAAKQPTTRIRRIEKYIPLILTGKGMMIN